MKRFPRILVLMAFAALPVGAADSIFSDEPTKPKQTKPQPKPNDAPKTEPKQAAPSPKPPAPVPPKPEAVVRQPVPGAGEQARADKLIREAFARDYQDARSPAEKLGLAKKLLQQGDVTKGDAAGRYVLYREARELAVAAGDARTSLAAVDAIAKHFEGDPSEPRLEVLRRLAQSLASAGGPAAPSPAAARFVTDALLSLADDAARRDDYDTAARATAAAETAARAAKDVAYLKAVQARHNDARHAQQEAAKLKFAVEKLRVNPADPAASLAVGRFQCFVKDDWDGGGLRLLAQSADPRLKAAAERDLAAAADAPPATCTEVAAAWWAAADAEAADRTALRARAALWYSRALPKLVGLNKVLAEKRIAEAGRIASTGHAVGEVVVEALIDGGSTLHLTPAGLFWKSHGVAKPGLHDRADEPTYVNGVPWRPAWSKPGERGHDTSDTFPLKLGDAPDFAVELQACAKQPGTDTVDKRDAIRLEKKPGEVVVHIPDGQNGSRWYRLRLYRAP